MLCLQKITFRHFYPAKKPTYSVMRFLKNHDIEKKRKKQFLNQEFQIRNRFWNRFFTTHQTLNQEFQNMSHFQSTLNNSSFLESEFLQHVKFWNIFFTTRQILIRNFKNATDFYVKLVLKKEYFLDNLFSNNLSTLVRIQVNLKQLVSFWIRTLQRVSFRIKLLSFCRFLLWLSALHQNLSQDFYNASDFDEKTVFRNLKLLEKLLPQKMFHSKKKNFIKSFEYNCFLNQFLYNASCFESISQTRQT